MIKINLIPVKEKKKRQEFLIIFAAVVVLVVVALGLFWIYIQRVQVRTNLDAQIKQVDEESKGYMEKINEEKDLENKEASLNTFKKTIQGIAETQRKILVTVDQVALALPDGVWITTLGQGTGTDGNKFIVDGYAFSRASLQNYFSALQNNGGFLKDTTLEIKNISASVGNNKQIIQFEITTKAADLTS